MNFYAKKNQLSRRIKGHTINYCDLIIMRYFGQGGHADCMPRVSRDLATPLTTNCVSNKAAFMTDVQHSTK